MPPIAVSQASVCRRVIADASSDPAVELVSTAAAVVAPSRLNLNVASMTVGIR